MSHCIPKPPTRAARLLALFALPACSLAASAQEVADAAAPALVHLEALTLGRDAATPWSFHPAWFVLLSLAIPALAWTGLAWKRALDEDPHRLRRQGRRELQRLLNQMGKQGQSPAASHLHAWIRATARTWGVGLSAPTPVHMDRALETHAADTAQHAAWRDLWHSTERGLFAAEATPPADWLPRASGAAAQVQIPPRERWLPNRRRHWLPMLGLLMALGLAGAPQHLSAQAPAAGQVVLPDAPDLTDAKATAQQALAVNWNDWAAHHNIAAANMQQQNWNAAVAHATASFLQNPSSAAIQDNLRFALTQVQSTDPALKRLLSGRWHERLASWQSAAQWQRFALVASLLLAAALTATVLFMYMPQRRPVLLASRGALAVSILAMLVSIHGWRSYGALGTPSAGMLVLQADVSPEPTDLTPREASSPAAAGTILQLRRQFLEWQQVKVRDDLTGWVRRDAVMPFYSRTASVP